MTTKFAKTATVTASTIAFIAILLAYPAISTATAQTSTSSGHTSTPSTSSTTTWNTNSTTPTPGHGGRGGPPSQGGGPGIGGTQQGGRGFGQPQGRVDVSVGQTITLTSTAGRYAVIGDASENGTASGSLVFTVSGNLTGGYTLSISGSVVIGTTTYTISSGSAEMNPSATAISGQGSTSPTGAFDPAGNVKRQLRRVDRIRVTGHAIGIHRVHDLPERHDSGIDSTRAPIFSDSPELALVGSLSLSAHQEYAIVGERSPCFLSLMGRRSTLLDSPGSGSGGACP